MPALTSLRCPVCGGPLANWVVRKEFTCHHCAWALASNVGTAFARGVWAGVLFEVCVAIAVFLAFGWVGAIGWLQVLGLAGLAVGAVVYRASLQITPLRAQRRAGMERNG